jgi:DNA-binding CsgD family transcriptional regulator
MTEIPAVPAETAPDIEQVKQRFTELYPRVLKMASYQHRRLHGHLRDDAVADTVAMAWRYYRNMALKGGDADRLLGTIVSYSAKHTRAGRKVGASPRSDDVLARSGQCRVAPLPHSEKEITSGRVYAALEAKGDDPAEKAVCNADFEALLETLSPKERELAKSLQSGLNMNDVARQRGVSHTAIYDLRRTLARKWAARQGYSHPQAR